MKNIKIALGSTFLAIALSGCMTTSNLTDQQKADLTPYQTQLTQACVTYKGLRGESTETCESSSKHSTEVMQKYYLLYNEDDMIKSCKGVTEGTYDECLKNIQNIDYSKTTAELVNKYYPQ